MSELPCITVCFLPFIAFCIWKLKCIHITYSPVCQFVLLCAVLFKTSFRRPHMGIFLLSVSVQVSLFQIIHEDLWFILQWQRLGSRLIFSVWIDTFPNTIGLRGCLLCKKCVVFWWHCHGRCSWSSSPSAAVVHWAVCLFFCCSHGVIGHMALQSRLKSKRGQQNLCPVGCSVLSGSLCYRGNLYDSLYCVIGSLIVVEFELIY